MINRLPPLLFLLTLSSCSSLFYAPNQPNMPMVKEEGITKVNLSMGTGDYSSIFDLNAYHSFSNHAGVMLNFSNASMEGNILTAVDAGAGYFNSLGENFGFDIYGTAGYGSLSLLYTELFTGLEVDYGSVSLGRFAVQPGIFYTSRNFEAGVGCRLHYLTYGELPDVFSITTTREHFMLEPSLKISFGWPVVKISLQGTISEKLNSGYLDYDRYNISLGLTVRIKSKEQ